MTRAKGGKYGINRRKRLLHTSGERVFEKFVIRLRNESLDIYDYCEGEEVGI